MGIPTRPDLHETAQEVAGETRVASVDNDPIVLVDVRALLVGRERGVPSASRLICASQRERIPARRRLPGRWT